MELGDPEPAGVGPVAVVVQRQERLGLRGPGLPAEQDRLVPVGQVGVDAANIRRAACRSRLASVGRPDRVPAPVARATSHSSAAATCAARGLGRRLLRGLDDHPDLLHPQLPGGERLPGRGVLVLQQPRQPQPAGHLLPGAPGQPRQPGIGPGLRGLLGHPPPVRLRRQTPTATPPPATPTAPAPRPARPARRRRAPRPAPARPAPELPGLAPPVARPGSAGGGAGR